MKNSDQKKLIRAGDKILKGLTKAQQFWVLVAVMVVFSGYYLYTHVRQGQLSSQEKVIQATHSEELLKLKWDGSAHYFVKLNGGKSTFTDQELTERSDEDYWSKFSALDRLGRANQANARLSYDHYMAVKSMVRPRIPNDPIGWTYLGKSNNQQIYFNNGLVTLYNRSHLIAWMFSGDAGRRENLVTGTRAMNSPGMQDFETQISNVIYYRKLHVRYQVTPVYHASERLPRGVQIMAKSVEDKGRAYDMNVYIFNVQPGYEIDYMTGIGRAIQ